MAGDEDQATCPPRAPAPGAGEEAGVVELRWPALGLEALAAGSIELRRNKELNREQQVLSNLRAPHVATREYGVLFSYYS